MLHEAGDRPSYVHYDANDPEVIHLAVPRSRLLIAEAYELLHDLLDALYDERLRLYRSNRAYKAQAQARQGHRWRKAR